jgi:hypothetical protein
MEKIRLSNGQEFDLRPLGINSNDIRKTRLFKFTSELPIGEIQAMFRNSENISSIDHLLSTGTLRGNFSDCVAYKSLSHDDSNVYTVELSTDSIEREVMELRMKVAKLEEAQAIAEEPEA